MVQGQVNPKAKPVKVWQLRKLTKSGKTRYLSIGTILPEDWQAVKVFVEEASPSVYVLRLENIK